jgi:hypothetical protein
MNTGAQYSDWHRLIWWCAIIGSIGGAGGIFWGLIKWMNAVYHKTAEAVAHIDTIPLAVEKITSVALVSNATLKQVADVKLAVDTIQTNHLEHLAASTTALNETMKESVKILTSMDKGIAILVDRGT